MRYAIVAVCCVLVLPIAASDPGQPLDCSDWVFFEPGLTCSETPQQSLEQPAFFQNGEAPVQTVTSGDLLMLRYERIEFCNNTVVNRYSLIRLHAGAEQVLASLDERCTDLALSRVDRFETAEDPDAVTSGDKGLALVSFDAVNGSLAFPVISTCEEDGPYGRRGCGSPDYGGERRIMRIGGLGTLFEILQSYDPPAASLGFRVSYMPEGFQYADYFDTYYGTLASVGDWSQAQPLECGYPASAPEVGDYLEVTDSLPTPDPGNGYYYVTAVNYQGQRRYGRERDGTGLHGRDPAMLPVCE